MQSIKDLRYDRELDLLLFNGVPETQAHLYGEKFHCIHETRERFETSKFKKRKKNTKPTQKISRRLVLDPVTNKLSIENETCAATNQK